MANSKIAKYRILITDFGDKKQGDFITPKQIEDMGLEPAKFVGLNMLEPLDAEGRVVTEDAETSPGVKLAEELRQMRENNASVDRRIEALEASRSAANQNQGGNGGGNGKGLSEKQVKDLIEAATKPFKDEITQLRTQLEQANSAAITSGQAPAPGTNGTPSA